MSTKKLMTLGTILMVLALATVGVAYGMWTETLTVNGNVTTGTFDVVFMSPWFDEPADAAGVGDCQMTLTNTDHNLQVTITNAYPGYYCEGGASFHNIGTIPAEIISVTPMGNTVPWGPIFYYTAPADGMIAAGEYDGGVSIDFLVPDTATEGQTYTFSYQIIAQQYVP